MSENRLHVTYAPTRLQGGVVRFRWKDYNGGHRVKIMALPAEEFIRRFLLHFIPERFVRIRVSACCASGSD